MKKYYLIKVLMQSLVEDLFSCTVINLQRVEASDRYADTLSSSNRNK